MKICTQEMDEQKCIFLGVDLQYYCVHDDKLVLVTDILCHASLQISARSCVGNTTETAAQYDRFWLEVSAYAAKFDVDCNIYLVSCTIQWICLFVFQLQHLQFCICVFTSLCSIIRHSVSIDGCSVSVGVFVTGVCGD